MLSKLLQPSKVYALILVRESGISTLAILEQFWNAPVVTVITLVGITNVSIILLQFLNAYSPIVFRVSLNCTFVLIPLQLSNAYLPIEVTLPSEIDFIEVSFWNEQSPILISSLLLAI